MPSNLSYLVFDGDQIGDHLARAYLSNDEEFLIQIDRDLRLGMARAEAYLVSKGLCMIASGADGITCKGTQFDPASCFAEVNRISTPFSISMGCAHTLRDAFICLRYAKANGRNRWARMLEDRTFEIGKAICDTRSDQSSD